MDLQSVISKCVLVHKTDSKYKNVSNSENTIFDSVLNSIEMYNNRKVSSISDLKKREAKKYRGDIWEEFCYLYLLTLEKYAHVWLIKDLPSKYRTKLNLPKSDNGIDIVCEEDGSFTAVQCKYRAKKNAYITWKGLSTFVGLTSLYEKWEDKIVMTNCKGISIKVKGHGLSRMGYSYFAKTELRLWKNMSALKISKKREDDIEEVVVKKIPVKRRVVKEGKIDIDDVRAARIRYYENMLKTNE